MAGFIDPLFLLMFGCVVAVLLAIYAANPQTPSPQPAPIPGSGMAYAPYVFQDADTGCQYLSTHMSAGLVPRIAANGRTHMGCKGGANGKS